MRRKPGERVATETAKTVCEESCEKQLASELLKNASSEELTFRVQPSRW